MIVLAPGTEDPALSGCRLLEATSTFPALARAEYPTWPRGLTEGCGRVARNVGAGGTAAAETEPGPGWDQVGTRFKSCVTAWQMRRLPI